MRLKGFSSSLATLALLVGCSTTTNPKEVSWYEKQIEALHYTKSNKEIDFATKIKNQKECEDYGKKNWGETTDYGDWHGFTVFKYSPVYDKCFAKRESNNYKTQEHQITIFDLLSGSNGGIFTFMSWCRDSYKKNNVEISPNDLDNECPTEHQINDAWLSLLGE